MMDKYDNSEPASEKMKKIAVEWNDLDDKKKIIYENDAAKQKEIYKMNISEYEQNGFYSKEGDMSYYRKPRSDSQRLDLTQIDTKRGRKNSNSRSGSKSQTMKKKKVTDSSEDSKKTKKSNNNSKEKSMKGRSSKSKSTRKTRK